MVCASARAQRLIVEECLKWVSQRKAFGKPLSSQAVVRAKLAAMIARAEAVQAWLENVTYQMCNMVRKVSPAILFYVNDKLLYSSRTRNNLPTLLARSLS